jgi:hypothetical protein
MTLAFQPAPDGADGNEFLARVMPVSMRFGMGLANQEANLSKRSPSKRA